MSPDDVSVRYFEEQDLNDFADYWYRSPPGFWEGRAFNQASMPPENEFRERWLTRLREKKPLPVMVQTVLFKGDRVGVHSSTHHQPNQSLIMHAHFFFEKFRGKGIGTISYVKAMERFLIDFNLKEIVFKTPLQNIAPMRIKEKLGIPSEGEETLDWPQITPGTRARIFRVTLPELMQIKQRVLSRI